jgi:hypothetical protein
MSKSHTNKATASASELRLVPGLGLIDLAKPDLPASLVDNSMASWSCSPRGCTRV